MMDGRRESRQMDARSERRLIRPQFVWVTFGLLFLVVIAGVLLPVRGRPRWWARMTAAMGYMGDELVFAERWFREERIVDRDGDGKGEFGTLADLLPVAERIGVAELARKTARFRPELNEAKICWGSYLLKVYVPENPDTSEEMWCAVAWPERYGKEAKHSLVRWVGPDFPRGRAARVDDRRYSGWGRGPRLEEIFAGDPFTSHLDWTRWKR